MSGTKRELLLNGRKITLIGTAHVSAESVVEVENTIRELKPDCVAIELDEKRAESITNKDKFRELDIVKVLKNNQGFLLIANLILSTYQKRMGNDVGVQPGEEMLKGMEVSSELGIPVVMADRPIQITLKRAWSKSSFWGKCKLLSALLSSAFTKEELSETEIENIKNKNEMDSMMAELADFLPVIKEVLIDERDSYLATKIWESSGDNIVAVLGAGHMNGVVANLEKYAAEDKTKNIEEISSIPPKGFFGHIAGWIIPVIIVGLIVAGFIYGGKEMGTKQVLSWFIWNGGLAGLTSLLALAHPITILVAIVSAPFTSLSPFIGVGFVTGIVQAFVCKPKVSDIESLQDDFSFKGIYKNRLLRVLLVFLMSTLGSAIGTFVSGSDIIAAFFK